MINMSKEEMTIKFEDVCTTTLFLNPYQYQKCCYEVIVWPQIAVGVDVDDDSLKNNKHKGGQQEIVLNRNQNIYKHFWNQF